MKYIIYILLIPFLTFSQNKGASPISNNHEIVANKNTYAVVVGISDYQDPAIPDLRFADKDADAFANFLRSPAGGSLDGDHLRVLTNEQATAGRIAEALDGLIEQAKEGDQVMIYFSGHGDVEGKKISQPGFLLAWDAPSSVYMGGGTYSLSFLQEVVTTLTVQSKAKVMVITDACHAGKLAGNQIGGSQLTTANLAKQYANEIKILSCQPNEFSIEGTQWGGGRGAFSYHLLDALYGLADNNKDLFITLQEVSRYLDDHVSADVAPVSQVPIVIGNRKELLAKIDSGILENIRKGKAIQSTIFSFMETRNMEEKVLMEANSDVRTTYQLFKEALKNKLFLEPADSCADYFYKQLMAESSLSLLHKSITRNYAAALQDEAQQTLNQWLKINQDLSLVNYGTKQIPQKLLADKYKSYPQCLERSADLLGVNHYMYKILKARKYFFEGYLMAKSNRNPNQNVGNQAIALFRQSLFWQPEQPHVYLHMGLVFGYNLLRPDSLEYFTQRAMENYPNWISPLINTSFCLLYKYKMIKNARYYLDKATQIDSNNWELLNAWAIYYSVQRQFDRSEELYKKSINCDSTQANTYISLGIIYYNTRRYPEAEDVYKKSMLIDSTIASTYNNLGNVYGRTHRYAEAEKAYKKAMQLDSNMAHTYDNLGVLYLFTKRYDDAESHHRKSIAKDSTYALAYNNLGSFYYHTQRFSEAEVSFKKSIQLDTTDCASPNYNLACLYSRTHRLEEAYEKLEQSIEKGYNNFIHMQKDEDLAALRNQDLRWNTLLRNAHVPDTLDAKGWNNLGKFYIQNLQYGEAEKVLKIAITLDSIWASSHYLLGKTYLRTNRTKEAKIEFLADIKLSPQTTMSRIGMAAVVIIEGKFDEAMEWVAQAIEKGGVTFDILQSDEDLAQLRTLPEWKELMRKYFPDKMSNK